MKFKLRDASIIEAKKDCECAHHDGPHWLYIDKIWRFNNEHLCEKNGALASVAYIESEKCRLRNKAETMERKGIVEIIYDEEAKA